MKAAPKKTKSELHLVVEHSVWCSSFDGEFNARTPQCNQNVSDGDHRSVFSADVLLQSVETGGTWATFACSVNEAWQKAPLVLIYNTCSVKTPKAEIHSWFTGEFILYFWQLVLLKYCIFLLLFYCFNRDPSISRAQNSSSVLWFFSE